MSKAIAVVEDDESIREMLRYYFQSVGYAVRAYESGEALFAGEEGPGLPALYILDIMLPGMDGLEILRRLREGRDTADVPVIMLTARSAEMDRVAGLENGADDYVVKPFSPKELMMRVSAILKRSGGGEAQRDVVTYGGLTVDFTGRLVYIDGKRVDMTPKEYDLFFYLVKNKGIALTREKLINEVWGYDFYGDDRTLDTHIKLLRKSLGEYSGTITTLRGVGYRFEGC